MPNKDPPEWHKSTKDIAPFLSQPWNERIVCTWDILDIKIPKPPHISNNHWVCASKSLCFGWCSCAAPTKNILCPPSPSHHIKVVSYSSVRSLSLTIVLYGFILKSFLKINLSWFCCIRKYDRIIMNYCMITMVSLYTGVRSKTNPRICFVVASPQCSYMWVWTFVGVGEACENGCRALFPFTTCAAFSAGSPSPFSRIDYYHGCFPVVCNARADNGCNEGPNCSRVHSWGQRARIKLRGSSGQDYLIVNIILEFTNVNKKHESTRLGVTSDYSSGSST